MYSKHFLVVGASGFVGQRIMARLANGSAIGTYHRHPFPDGVRFDSAAEDISNVICQTPGPISHAFVLMASVGTEACAQDPLGTAAINVQAAWRTLESLLDAGIVPVYVSTDYVFDGSRGNWQETDRPCPTTQYGVQKREVETRLLADPRPSLIVRLSRVVGTTMGTHSVLGPWSEEIRSGGTQRCATDQIFSPIAVDDAAGALIALAKIGASGVYHLGGPVPFSRIGLLRLLVDNIQAVAPKVRPDIVACLLHDLPFTEKLPVNTSLAIDKFQAAVGWRFTPMADLCATLALRHFGAGR